MTETAPQTKHRVSRSTLVRVTVLSLCIAATLAWWVVIRPIGDDSAGLRADPADQTTNDTASLGQPAPDATFAGLNGPEVRLRDLRGTTVVVNFWASTCAPCIKEMPLLERASKERSDVTFLGVSVTESVDAGLAMIERTGVTFDQVRDPAGDQLAAFRGIALPHTVVIDADGTVVALANRALRDDADVDELIGRAG